MTDRSVGHRLGAGLAIAALAQFLGLFLAGAGHGWVSPLFASIAMWVLAPATFVIGRPDDRSARLSLLAIVLIAVGVDAWLIRATLEELSHFQAYVAINGALGWVLILLWLALWASWQVVVIASLFSARKAADAAA